MIPSTADIAKAVAEVAVRYDIERVWLFGSFARVEANAESDIDLCLETGPDFSLFDAGGVGWAIERELGRRVDIAAEDTLYPHVREAHLLEHLAYNLLQAIAFCLLTHGPPIFRRIGSASIGSPGRCNGFSRSTEIGVF